MKKIVIYIFCVISSIACAFCQQNKPYLEESKPLTPAAYQYLKYTGLPVTEYTGIPDVSVPIYEIDEDGIKFPINLTYHASGITVNEEASYVGLGWNLQFGSIVQIINDENDLNPKNTKLLPDYIGTTIPSDLPLRHPWPWETPGGPTSFPVGNVSPDYRFPIATHYYFPVNGDYTIDRYNLLTSPDYDSEPDLFKANFLGYSINFIKDFNNGGQIVVLNKAGYRVEKLNDDSWCITVPSGEQFYFAFKNVSSSEVSSSTKTSSSPQANPSYSVNYESSVIWYLTKIVTKRKKEILINYTASTLYENLPNFTQTWKKATQTQSSNLTSSMTIRAFWNTLLSTDNIGNLTTTMFLQKDRQIFPASIVFPLGRLDFYNSIRDDVAGGQKIDSIALNGNSVHATYKFNYSYFNSAGVGGNGFSYGSMNVGNRHNLRLKLDSFIDGVGGNYQFVYNSTLLPGKNSFAQDQWGYYNGALTNTTLIPNPTQYNKPELGNNGDNHSANETYTKASSLSRIIYPTGGSINFDFELNSFDNYWVPDYATSSNTVSHGNGLRVRAITWKQADQSISKMQNFDYTGGKALCPVNIYRNYNHPTGNGFYNNAGSNPYFTNLTYFVDEFNGHGYYTPSSLAAMNGVGYNQVTNKLLDQTNASTGSIVTEFHNNPAVLPSNSVQFMSKIAVSVPARENWDLPKNGTVKSVKYFDQGGILQKKSLTTSYNYKSPLFYGGRISGYGDYIFYVPPSGSNPGQWSSKLQFMVAEYPIYDFETLPYNTVDTEYFTAGDSLLTTTEIYYNGNRFVNQILKRCPNYIEDQRFQYNVLPAMAAQNRLQDMTDHYFSRTNKLASVSYKTPSDVHIIEKSFKPIGNHFVPDKETERNLNQTAGNTMTYSIYDEFSNPAEMYDNEGRTNLIWGYGGKYLIAKVENANYSDVRNVLGGISAVYAFSSNPSPTDAAVRAFLAPLRTDSRVNRAKVTTYTYKPLVGLSSETDPTGITSYYEYDDKHRLAFVKDQSGNIIKSYDYHFAGQ